MNAVIQSSAPPAGVLERNTLITHALLNRLSAYTRSIFRVSDLHRGKTALSVQRLIPVHLSRRQAAGKQLGRPESASQAGYPRFPPCKSYRFIQGFCLLVFQASSLKTAK